MMGIRTTGAFLAGAVVGWTARGFFGSTREALLVVVRYTQVVREHLMREVASQAEWLEDLMAEGRARHDHVHVPAPVDESMPPQVVVRVSPSPPRHPGDA